MDYKEKYEQALEVAKETYNKQPMYKDWLESIFPELKESEDERIRKGLIKAVSRTFEGNKLYGTDVTREEALAWLEKPSGEQKPVWNEEDEEHIDSLLKRLDGLCRNEFERTRFAINEDEDWLKSLKERIGG